MTKPPARATLLRKIERLETQVLALKQSRFKSTEFHLQDTLELSDLRLRVKWAMSILQTGDLPDGSEK